MADCTVKGLMARTLAGRLDARGYVMRFPPGRDPATFTVTNLPGGPEVEVTAEDGGRISCHYIGSSPAEAAKVIARLLAPGRPQADTMTGIWDGIAIEWHYLPPQERPANVDEITAVLLAHLAVLVGG